MKIEFKYDPDSMSQCCAAYSLRRSVGASIGDRICVDCCEQVVILCSDNVWRHWLDNQVDVPTDGKLLNQPGEGP